MILRTEYGQSPRVVIDIESVVWDTPCIDSSGRIKTQDESTLTQFDMAIGCVSIGGDDTRDIMTGLYDLKLCTTDTSHLDALHESK